MVLHECPYCHRPFEAELLSKEEIDSREATRVRDFPIEMSPVKGIAEGGITPARASGIFGLIFGLDESERKAISMHPELFVTYKLGYKCKHCKKQWTKLSVEEKPLPRQYVLDEEEKTDQDTEIEQEEAREEEYARQER